MKKTHYLTGIVGLGLFISTAAAIAPSTYAFDINAPKNFLERIIERFNLNKDEVDKVVQEVRIENQAERRSAIEARLSQAVSDGRITEAQKGLMIAKMTEWQNTKGDLHELSMQERQEKIETHREEMRTWADQNGIDLSLMLGNGPKGFSNGNRGSKRL